MSRSISFASNIGRASAFAYIATAALLVCLFAPLFFFKPVRVGDGSEYYALFLAIKNELHPWMTSSAFHLYDDLMASNTIQGLVTTDMLRNAFPALRAGATADFNHFWMYSLVSAVFAKTLQITGIHIGIHHAFLLQHAFLLLATTWLALGLFGKRGLAAVLLLTLASPIIWFADKVHTEFFSYCLVLSAVMFAQSRLYIWGALCLALTSTQNPSFALLAFVLLVFRLFQLPQRPFQLWEAGALVATCVAVLLHPAYYYFRFGVPTPQMLAGGAKIGVNASSFYIWLLDPDVGLLPNWPLGIGLILMGSALFLNRRSQGLDRPFLFFLVLYLVINLFAQSSTVNINSGATPGLARYALWYIPIFFPLALTTLNSVSGSLPIVRVFTFILMIGYVLINILVYDPRKYESYATPSSASRIIQRKFPDLYDPPPEVFAERFSGFGESTKTHNLSAILGPSCDKLLIIPGRDPSEIARSEKCLVDDAKLKILVLGLLQGAKGVHYVHLADPANDIGFAAGATYRMTQGQTALKLLSSGWHPSEGWGTWSGSPVAELLVPCPLSSRADSFKVGLSMVGLESPQHPATSARLRSENVTVWAGEVRGTPTEAIVTLKRSSCASNGTASISVEADQLRSPKDIGTSQDARKLGIGLLQIYYP